MEELKGEKIEDKDWSELEIKEVKFEKCTFIGVDFSDCRRTKAVFDTCKFVSCKFGGSYFSSCRLLNCTFKFCTMFGACFDRCKTHRQQFFGNRFFFGGYKGRQLELCRPALLRLFQKTSGQCGFHRGRPVRRQL